MKKSTECPENCRYIRTIISDYSSDVKYKLNKYYQNQTFLLMTYDEKCHILRLLRLVIPLLRKTWIIYPKVYILICNIALSNNA